MNYSEHYIDNDQELEQISNSIIDSISEACKAHTKGDVVTKTDIKYSQDDQGKFKEKVSASFVYFSKEQFKGLLIDFYNIKSQQNPGTVNIGICLFIPEQGKWETLFTHYFHNEMLFEPDSMNILKKIYNVIAQQVKNL